MGGAQTFQKTREISPNEELLLRGPEGNTAMVLDNYPPADISQPMFQTGDWLKVLSTDGYWWKIYSLRTKEVNYIPYSYVTQVYHGWLFENICRSKAEELLSHPENKLGSFLIRESRKGSYSLSVRHRAIMHYRINRMPNNWYFISPRLTFQCLEDLVNHYHDTADGLCCVLTGPCLTFSEPNQPDGRRSSSRWRTNLPHFTKSSELVQPSRSSTKDPAISYGLWNSISSYMSLLGQEEKPARKKFSLKKWRSVYQTRDHSTDRLDMMEDGYEEVP